MFGSIKTFVAGLNAEPKLKGNYRVATAALVIRAATVSHAMSEARRGRLHALLKSRFGLDDVQTVDLIDEATAVEQNAIDLYSFTSELVDLLDEEGRRQIVKMMWEVVYADDRVNEFESNIIWRAADLLGVSSRSRIELRRHVVADKAVLAAV